MDANADELKAQLHAVHAAFGKMTFEAQQLRDQLLERDRRIDKLELQRHHDGIRIMGLVEDNAQLKNTIKQKIETVRMGNSDDDTDELTPIDAKEPPPPSEQVPTVRIIRSRTKPGDNPAQFGGQ